MENTAVDLHNHLFAQLDRVTNTSLKGAELIEEMRRADTVCKISAQIISNQNMVINAHRMAEDCGLTELPNILSDKEKKEAIQKQPRRLLNISHT